MAEQLSIVVPVYNSESSLPLLVERLSTVLKQNAREYEVILVDDGSQDRSAEVALSLSKQYAWVRLIRLMRNYGQHNALLCGLRMARYPVCVTLDDDLQNPPEEIPKLLAVLDQGWDVVYGTPVRSGHDVFRRLASKLIRWSLRTTIHSDVADKISSFRVIRQPVTQAFADFKGPFFSLDVLLSWGTTRFASVPVAHERRAQGESNYSTFALVVHALNLVVGLTTLPLRLTAMLGLCFSVFGFVALLYVVIHYWVAHGSVPGFPFIASIISIFSGVQLFCLGIIGEYMGRIYSRSMDKPTYQIRSATPSV